MSWHRAKRSCISVGGRLMEAEEDDLTDLSDSNADLWFGVNDLAHHNVWVRTDSGLPLHTMDIFTCNYKEFSGHCARLNHNEKKIIPTFCDKQFGYICEKAANDDDDEIKEFNAVTLNAGGGYLKLAHKLFDHDDKHRIEMKFLLTTTQSDGLIFSQGMDNTDKYLGLAVNGEILSFVSSYGNLVIDNYTISDGVQHTIFLSIDPSVVTLTVDQFNTELLYRQFDFDDLHSHPIYAGRVPGSYEGIAGCIQNISIINFCTDQSSGDCSSFGGVIKMHEVLEQYNVDLSEECEGTLSTKPNILTTEPEITLEPTTKPNILTTEAETTPEPTTKPNILTTEVETTPEPTRKPNILTTEPETTPRPTTTEAETTPEPTTRPNILTTKAETTPEPTTKPNIITTEAETTIQQTTRNPTTSRPDIYTSGPPPIIYTSSPPPIITTKLACVDEECPQHLEFTDPNSFMELKRKFIKVNRNTTFDLSFDLSAKEDGLILSKWKNDLFDDPLMRVSLVDGKIQVEYLGTKISTNKDIRDGETYSVKISVEDREDRFLKLQIDDQTNDKIVEQFSEIPDQYQTKVYLGAVPNNPEHLSFLGSISNMEIMQENGASRIRGTMNLILGRLARAYRSVQCTNKCQN